MANERANPLDLSDFEPAPSKPRQAAVKEDDIAVIAEANRFTSREPSRQARPTLASDNAREQGRGGHAPRRKGRPSTGRNVQFNAKVTLDTNDKAYELVERLSVTHAITLGEMLERAFAALERELAGGRQK